MVVMTAGWMVEKKGQTRVQIMDFTRANKYEKQRKRSEYTTAGMKMKIKKLQQKI